jgi:hypothetical protein
VPEGYLVEYDTTPSVVPSTNGELFISAIDGVPTSGRPDQVEISVGQCITLTFLVRYRTGPFVDVTGSPNTLFFTSPARGTFPTQNVFCATEAERNKVFTLYGRNSSPVAGQTITDTVIIKVRP